MNTIHRLTLSEKKKIKELCKKGYSLNQIANKINLGKSTTFYWYKKYKGKTIKQIKINDNLQENVGEIIGAFAGDGNYYKGKNGIYRVRIYLSGNELQYTKDLVKIMKSVYSNIPIRIYDAGNMFIIDITRKAVIEHIKKYLEWNENRTLTIKLKKEPKYYSSDFLKGFCRGLIDTEGWVCKNNLMIASISPQLIDNLSKSLTIINVPHLKTKWKKTNKRANQRHAIFFNKKNTEQFSTKIGFSNVKRKNKLVPPMGISES